MVMWPWDIAKGYKCQLASVQNVVMYQGTEWPVISQRLPVILLPYCVSTCNILRNLIVDLCCCRHFVNTNTYFTHYGKPVIQSWLNNVTKSSQIYTKNTYQINCIFHQTLDLQKLFLSTSIHAYLHSPSISMAFLCKVNLSHDQLALWLLLGWLLCSMYERPIAQAAGGKLWVYAGKQNKARQVVNIGTSMARSDIIGEKHIFLKKAFSIRYSEIKTSISNG